MCNHESASMVFPRCGGGTKHEVRFIDAGEYDADKAAHARRQAYEAIRDEVTACNAFRSLLEDGEPKQGVSGEHLSEACARWQRNSAEASERRATMVALAHPSQRGLVRQMMSTFNARLRARAGEGTIEAAFEGTVADTEQLLTSI